ncbi:MAG: NAD(P)/FAD-dependent oxidoreductase [Chloroflexi bacterium]|nr:NAD(P)/FAD-dependent oxidoreductase [Chloroflexota bacterium]
MNASQSEQRTVVIGAGLSGLAAATYLARAGSAVTVLEKSQALGGRAATDTPRGFALNRGAHAFYTGGAGSQVLSELGVSYSAGIPRRYLARDARGRLHPFPATAKDLLRTSLLDAADKADLLRVFARIAMQRASDVGHVSTSDWIAQTTHRPKLRSFLESFARTTFYSAALELASADVFIARTQQTLQHPVHYVDGGWQSLVAGLRHAAESAGVEIQSAASASQITLRNGRAAGVRLHDGRQLFADAVVVATPPEDVLHLVPAQVAPRLRQTLTDLVPVHVACLDVALARLPMPSQPIVFDVEQPRFMTAQSEFARLAPDGGAVVHLLRYLHPRELADPASERAALEALLDQAQPGWRDVVTEQRFLPRMLAVGALPVANSGGMAGRPSPRTDELTNVFFAGDWVGPEGYLADAALASARAAARLAVAAQSRTLLAAA